MLQPGRPQISHKVGRGNVSKTEFEGMGAFLEGRITDYLSSNNQKDLEKNYEAKNDK